MLFVFLLMTVPVVYVNLIKPNNKMEEGFDFSEALKHLKSGKAIARLSWYNDYSLVLIPGSTFTVQKGRPLNTILEENAEVVYAPHIDVIYYGPEINNVEVFTFSHEDILADDWIKL